MNQMTRLLNNYDRGSPVIMITGIGILVGIGIISWTMIGETISSTDGLNLMILISTVIMLIVYSM